MNSTPSTLYIDVGSGGGNDDNVLQQQSVISDLDTLSFHQRNQRRSRNNSRTQNDTIGGGSSSIVASEQAIRDKFDFRYKLRSIKLKGRKKEIRLLREAFEQLLHERHDGQHEEEQTPDFIDSEQQEHQGSSSQLVLLTGPAGSGKSSLVETALRTYVSDRNGWFVSGKFDQHTNCVPFSALVEALTDFIELLLQQHDEGSSSLKRNLAGSMRNNPREAKVLKHLMPNIAMILDSAPMNEKDDSTDYYEHQFPASTGDNSEFHHEVTCHDEVKNAAGTSSSATAAAPSLNQLKTALRSFLYIAASREQPISIFIDDLQFADLESLDLIQAILSDEKSHHLLIVCSYRENEIDGFTQFEQGSSFHTQHIVAQCLSVSSVDQIIQDVVGRDNNKGAGAHEGTRALAELVFRKTLGNAYDVLEFLERLYMKNLLYHTEDGKGWQWDLGGIQKATDVSENVADTLIRDKVGRLPATSRAVLQVAAACVGHKFLVYFLEEVMATTGMTSTVYHNGLQAAMDDGVIESCEAHDHQYSPNSDHRNDVPSQWMKFTHDKVQQAVADMAAEDAMLCKQLHLRVGRFSWNFRKRLKMQNLKETFLFLALVNLSKCLDLIDDNEEKLDFVRLSLEAGKLSSSRCAFAQAANHVRKATSVVPQDVLWSRDNRELALNLYSFLAEMEMLVRRHDQCRDALETIYCHTTDSIDDRLEAFIIEVDNLCSESKLRDAIRTARNHIRVLGERFPANVTMLQLVSDLIRTKVRLGRLSDMHILSRPLMTDKRTKTVTVLIGKIMYSAQWLAREDKTLLACGLRLVRLTLDHGITSDGLSGFTVYSMVEAAMGNYAVSRRFENLVNCSFWHRSDTKDLLNCATRAGLGFMTTHLWKPLEECAREMESAAVVGINGVDLNESSTAIFGCLSTRVVCKPWTLPSLSREWESLRCEAVSLGILRRELVASSPSQQYCLNLQGEAKSKPTRLEGAAMDIVQSLDPDQAMLDGLDVYVVIFQIYLSYLFEDWDYVLEHVVQAEKTIRTVVQLYQTLLIFAMSGLQLYEETKKRRLLALAKRCRKFLRRLHESGSPNAKAPLMLVNAEYARVKHGSRLSNNHIEEGYQKALAEARQTSWVAEFICYERLLVHCCSCGNEPKARYYLDLVLDDVCGPWGATALAEHVSRRFSSLDG